MVDCPLALHTSNGLYRCLSNKTLVKIKAMNMAPHRKSITGVDLSFYPHLRQHGAGERERVFGFPDLWPFFSQP